MRLKQCVILEDEKLYTSYLIRSSENLPPPTPQKQNNTTTKPEIDKNLIRTSRKIHSTAA